MPFHAGNLIVWLTNHRHQWRQLLVGAIYRNSTISLADQVVASATNFLTGIIIARICVKEELGIYMLGFTIILLIHELQTSLISAPYMVFSPRLSAKNRSLYMGSSLVQYLTLSILVIVALLLGILVISYGFGSTDLATAIKALCYVIPFIMLRELVRRFCFANMKMGTAFIIDCIVAASQLGALATLAYSGFLSSNTAFYSIGFASGLTVLGWLVVKRHCYSFHQDHIWRDFKKNFSFGKWTLASSLLWTLGMTIYPWLLAYFHGTASTGVWAACWGIIAVANPILLGMQNFLGPKIVQSFTSNNPLLLKQFVLKVTIISLLIVTPLAIILSIFGGQLVVLFYGDKYSNNGHIVSILAINLLVITTSYTLSRALLAMEQARLYFLANIVPLIVILSIGAFFVKQFGAMGVAWGLLLGYVTTSITMFYMFLILINRAIILKK